LLSFFAFIYRISSHSSCIFSYTIYLITRGLGGDFTSSIPARPYELGGHLEQLREIKKYDPDVLRELHVFDDHDG
jgi:hypothetical protein